MTPSPDDLVFKALADPLRREILDRLRACNGQSLRELCAPLNISRQAVSKHLAVLQAANLVVPVRRGREKWHYLNPVPIEEIRDRWIGPYERDRVIHLVQLKRALEESPDEQAQPGLRPLHPVDPGEGVGRDHRS